MGHQDFDIVLQGKGELGEYRLLASFASRWAHGPDRSILPIKQLGNHFRFTHHFVASPENIASMGGKLYRFLFPHDILLLYQQALEQIEDGHLRVRLIWKHNRYVDEIVNSAQLKQHVDWELSTMPWECCHDGQKFVFMERNVSLVRTSAIPPREARPSMPQPFRLLMVTASPHNLAELQVEQEGNKLSQMVAGLTKQGKLELRIEKQANFARFKQALAEFQPHMLHLSGHGEIDQGEGAFMLCNDDGDGFVPLRATKLANLLKLELDHPPYFVLLNGCKTAASGVDDLNRFHGGHAEPMVGMAPYLVRQGGIGAVLAMQFNVPDTAALNLMAQFYKSLIEGERIDQAVTKVRQDLHSRPDSAEGVWIVPSLFMCDRPADIAFAPDRLTATVVEPTQAKVHQALLKFNYIRQKKQFTPILNHQKKAGAFLLSDSSEDEIRWLMHRLVCHLPHSQQKKKADISIQEVSEKLNIPFDISQIWRQVGAQVAKKNTASQYLIKNSLKQALQSHNVLIILRDVAYEEEGFAKKVLQEFWHPLLQDLPDHAPFWLILIMTDSEGEFQPSTFDHQLLGNTEVERFIADPANCAVEPWPSNKLVHLDRLTPVTLSEVSDWLDSATDLHDQLDDIIQNDKFGFSQHLEQQENPIKVIREICAVCEYPWSAVQERIRKL